MAELLPTDKSKGIQNWLKGALALMFAKQGLHQFVEDELTQFQENMLAAIRTKKALPSERTCNECTTKNVLPCPTLNFCSTGRCQLHDRSKLDATPNRKCPSSICEGIRKVIQLEHRYNKPSWRNTDATRWCTDAFEILKCYLPPDGYAAVTTLEETDFNGILAVIINNKRFQNKMAEQLNLKDNVCIEARCIGRKIRHSADCSVSDTELTKYIDTLIRFLSDTKYLAADEMAREAVDKLKLLKSNALAIPTSDIETVLDTLKATAKTLRKDAIEEISDSIKTSLANMLTVATSKLDEIIVMKGKQIKEELRKEIGLQPQTQTPKTQQEELEQCMRDDLIQFYQQYHSTISVAPLAEELDVHLCEFYVEPPLTSVNVRKMYGKSTQHCKMPINSYHDLFFHGGGNICQHIFVKANAGVGKTSFAKRICMTWCQAHSPTVSLTTKFKQRDVDTMRAYDFLFLLSLRDQDPSICDVDNMICNCLLSELARSSRYTKREVQDALHTSTCLVIIDGLDEWSHPTNCIRGCPDPDALPHIPARKHFSVLMTTRPWKLDVVNPRISQIDKIVEINEMDSTLSEQLVTNAIAVLESQVVSNQSKTAEEFQKVTSTLKLGSMIYIPYILLQMVCLWFDGKSIGNSKCEIYRNVIELTLSRGLIRLQKKGLHPPETQSVSYQGQFPSFLLSCKLFRTHSDVMLHLAELAFKTLFSLDIQHVQSRLVFERSMIPENIQDNTLAFCLELGLLSQNKYYGSVSCKGSNFSYQHKSLHEFFAAIYIQSCSDKQCVRETIAQVCTTLPAILDMSNVFIFLGGFCHVTCWETLQMLTETIERDGKTREFRGSIRSKIWPFSNYHKNTEFILARFQNMLTDIVQETKDNFVPFGVKDIFVDEHDDDRSLSLLKPLIHNARGTIKSLSLDLHEPAEQFTKILETLELHNVQSLHKLVIEALLKEEDLNRLLCGSIQTLACLILQSKNVKNVQLSPDTTDMIINMDNLNSLSLRTVTLHHSYIQKLFEHIGNMSTMQEIALANIVCKDHDDSCKGHCIDLSQHQKLKLLKLETIPLSELRVYAYSLETCLLGKLPAAIDSAVERCLAEASNLYELRVYGAVWVKIQDKPPTWEHLKSLFVIKLDLGDKQFLLPPEMRSIEDVRFSHVTTTIEALRGLVQSIDDLPQPVTLKLHKCIVPSLKEYRQIKDEIRSSSKYQIQADEDNYFKYTTMK